MLISGHGPPTFFAGCEKKKEKMLKILCFFGFLWKITNFSMLWSLRIGISLNLIFYAWILKNDKIFKLNNPNEKI